MTFYVWNCKCNVMYTLKSYSYALLLMWLQSEQARGHECKIGGIVGECVPLPECPQLVSLLKTSSSTAEGLQTSQERRCGLDTVNIKVCCPIEDKDPKIVRQSHQDDVHNDSTKVNAFPDHDTCGWADADRIYSEARVLTPEEVAVGHMRVIANGIQVLSRDMARYMAVLGYKTESTVLWECGGSIITEKHILTAAHCIRKSLYVVRVGEIDLFHEEKDAGPVDFLIKKTIPHEEYTKFHNDIAIIVLEGTINFKEDVHIGPICLPIDSKEKMLTKPRIRNRAGIFVAGWGEAPEKRERPTFLSYAPVNIVGDAACKKLYGGEENRTIDERVFCAGDTVGKHDACNGDSGGPLVAEYELPEYNRTFFYQLGIISYGYRCSRGYFSGVYTNVTHFLPWIREQVLATRL